MRLQDSYQHTHCAEKIIGTTVMLIRNLICTTVMWIASASIQPSIQQRLSVQRTPDSHQSNRKKVKQNILFQYSLNFNGNKCLPCRDSQLGQKYENIYVLNAALNGDDTNRYHRQLNFTRVPYSPLINSPFWQRVRALFRNKCFYWVCNFPLSNHYSHNYLRKLSRCWSKQPLISCEKVK